MFGDSVIHDDLVLFDIFSRSNMVGKATSFFKVEYFVKRIKRSDTSLTIPRVE